MLGERKVRGCRLSVGGVFLPKLFYYRFFKLLLKHTTDSEARSLSPPAQPLVLCVESRICKLLPQSPELDFVVWRAKHETISQGDLISGNALVSHTIR